VIGTARNLILATRDDLAIVLSDGDGGDDDLMNGRDCTFYRQHGYEFP
jgi:hypothetical protein